VFSVQHEPVGGKFMFYWMAGIGSCICTSCLGVYIACLMIERSRMLISPSVSSAGLNSMFVWMFNCDIIFSASVLAWSYNVISCYMF
jgi:hypothetical protein